MADPVRGKLVWQGSGDKRVRRVIFPTKKGMSIPTPFDPDQLAASLQNRTEDEIEVDLEVVSGKPVRIRPVGEPFAASPPPPPVRSSQQPRGSQQRGQQGSVPQGQRQPQQRLAAVRGAFHNPYNFVPAPPRKTDHPELRDHDPIGHQVLHPDRFTGVIRVKMTVKTPLLVPDSANVVDCPNDHKSFPVRINAEGRPYIPPTSIKGMLRAAYEAVTNSRLAVFPGHDRKLQYRVWNRQTRSAPKRDYPVAPADLLPASLRPATSLQQLSPADRVFGWVNQRGKGAYKGNVRIGPVMCGTNDSIENFGTPGLPLAILGQPKPQQARFYVAKNQSGEAQNKGLTKEEAGYSSGKGLHGRKVYPHHNGLPNGHWDNAVVDRTQRAVNGHFQEYRRPRLHGQEQRDNQNRSIQGWVKPGTEFTFDIHVTNLSQVELGALLWLLSLPDNHYHRFGGGKPLGFGSVRLEIDAANTHLYDGKEWKQIYSTFDEVPTTEADRTEIVQAFQDAVRTSFGSPASFENVPFIAAWLKMATGHEDTLPTHYPRARQQGRGDPVPPNPEGLAYEWFVANDRTGHNGGPQVSLPNLANDGGLPMLDAPR